jgi:outer membrane protein W
MKGRVGLRSVGSWVVAGALILSVAGTAVADEKKWRMRVVGAVAGSDSGVFVGSDGFHAAGVLVNGGAGVGVNFEYRYSPRMGFEMGAMALGGDIRVGGWSKSGRYGPAVQVGGFVPLTFCLNFHPLEKARAIDLFVGPMIASTIYSRVGVPDFWGVESGVDLGLGVNLGADVNLGQSRWSLNAGIKYIPISAGGSTTHSGRDPGLAFEPVIFNFGFGFRF